MKKNLWLVSTMMLSAGMLAQTATNSATTIDTPAAAPMATNAPGDLSTNAPAKPKKKGKKKSAKSKESLAELKTVPLVAGPAEVVATTVRVRGQAKLNSEVVTRLKKGDQVTVIEEIVRNNSGPDEPSAWAKIVLPATAHIWANASFVDQSGTVKATKLHLRSGPGENFSVLGELKNGDTVKQLGEKNGWLEVEAPAGAYAFVAAQYLKQGGEEPARPVEPAPATTQVNEPPTVATAPTEPPATPTPPVTPADTNALSATNLTATTNAVPEEPPPPRIVQREGIVRGLTSIQAPSNFELISTENGRTIDYLFTTSSNLDLRRYKGLRIFVSGEESVDERWKHTPVLTIQRIQVED